MVSQELLEQMRQDFETAYYSNSNIKKYLDLVGDYKADYKAADRYAMEVGAIREKVVLKYLPNISPSEFKEVASQVLLPQLKDNYTATANYTEAVQTILNQKARIGLKAKKPEFNTDKASGLVNLLSSALTQEEAYSAINQNIVTFTKGIVSDSIYDNAQLHYDVGLDPVIRRVAFPGCCKWCTSMAGTYRYAEVKNTGNDVYRFHSNCRCHITYDPRDGSRKINTRTQREYTPEAPKPIEPRTTATPKTTTQKTTTQKKTTQEYENLDNKSRKQLEDLAVRLAPRVYTDVSATEAKLRAMSLLDGNTNAQLKKFIKNARKQAGPKTTTTKIVTTPKTTTPKITTPKTTTPKVTTPKTTTQNLTTPKKTTRSSDNLKDMTRKQLEDEAVKLAPKVYTDISSAEAKLRAMSLLDGNSDAQLRKFIKNARKIK